MAVDSTREETRKTTPLPPADPALDHVVHMGPNLDRLLRLRPQDLLKTRKTTPKR